MSSISPTSSPTSFMETWTVGQVSLALGGGGTSNYFDDGLTVTQLVGAKVLSSDDVKILLMQKGCGSAPPTSSDPVSLGTTNFVPGSISTKTKGVVTYDIDIDVMKIGNVDSDYLECNDFANSTCGVGSIQFCTRASSYEGSLEVAFRETNFDLNFNLTDNEITLENMVIEENVPDSFITDVNTDFKVKACRCNLENDCVTTLGPVQQDTSLVICIYPWHPTSGLEQVVKITNFDLTMKPLDSSNPVSFNAVQFGTDTWNPSSLVFVEPNNDDFKITIAMPVIAEFYIQEVNTIVLEGNAFLEFNSLKNRGTAFGDFVMEVNLEVYGMQVGCLQTLLLQIREFF